jgi:hypothetical protein
LRSEDVDIDAIMFAQRYAGRGDVSEVAAASAYAAVMSACCFNDLCASLSAYGLQILMIPQPQRTSEQIINQKKRRIG